MEYDVIPPLILKEGERIAKQYKIDNGVKLIIDLVAKSKGIRLEDSKSVSKFIIDYFLEIQVVLGLFYKQCVDKIVEQLAIDDIYKGIRIKYAGGSLLGSDVYKLIDIIK